jgi:hypothetical protein
MRTAAFRARSGWPFLMMLALFAVGGTAFAQSQPDGDGDGIPDGSDNCPHFENPAQVDTDQNERGDACECGDQDGNGRVNVADLIAINAAIFNPALVTALCDANNDGRCTVVDIVAANRTIFAPKTGTCARQPVPGPSATLSIDDISVAEGNAGTTSAVFRVTRSRASASVTTVAYATADGGATAPGDYLAHRGARSPAKSQPGETHFTQIPLSEPEEGACLRFPPTSPGVGGDGRRRHCSVTARRPPS